MGATISFVVRQVVQEAFVLLTPTTISLSNQAVGVASSPQNVTLTNKGNIMLAIFSVSISGDFQQTTNCGNSVATGRSCMIAVTFTQLLQGPDKAK